MPVGFGQGFEASPRLEEAGIGSERQGLLRKRFGCGFDDVAAGAGHGDNARCLKINTDAGGARCSDQDEIAGVSEADAAGEIGRQVGASEGIAREHDGSKLGSEQALKDQSLSDVSGAAEALVVRIGYGLEVGDFIGCEARAGCFAVKEPCCGAVEVDEPELGFRL